MTWYDAEMGPAVGQAREHAHARLTDES
jgi:hypothetical protein